MICRGFCVEAGLKLVERRPSDDVPYHPFALLGRWVWLLLLFVLVVAAAK
jgi:hypothetical protein